MKREAKFLTTLDHELIPKVIWRGIVDNNAALVEKRMPGTPLNEKWKSMSLNGKVQVIRDLIDFLRFMRSMRYKSVYSVNSGKNYESFYDCLSDSIDKKILRIQRSPIAKATASRLKKIIKTSDARAMFASESESESYLVHGDLINHNLLTDGKKLTGVLDWEMAGYGELLKNSMTKSCKRAWTECRH